MIIKKLIEELNSGEVIFPTTLNLALKIKKEIESDDSGVSEVAKAVQKEPVLSAKVLRLANSAAYNQSGKEITDLGVAISRVGIAAVKMLVMTLIVRQMTGNKMPDVVKAIAAETWQKATETAANSHVLAKMQGQPAPVAMTAGLMQYLPDFYMLSRLGVEADEKQINKEKMASVIEEHAHIVIEPLMKSLKVPSEISTAIKGDSDNPISEIIKKAKKHEECLKELKDSGKKEERDVLMSMLN